MAYSLRWKKAKQTTSPSTSPSLPAATEDSQLALPAPDDTQPLTLPAPASTAPSPPTPDDRAAPVPPTPPHAAADTDEVHSDARQPTLNQALMSAELNESTTDTDQHQRPASDNERSCEELRIHFADTPRSQPPRADGETERKLKTLRYNVLSLYRKSQVRGASNITADEARALRQLKQNTDVIIKTSDKCQRFVLLDKQQYIDKARALLDRRDDYCPVPKDPTPAVQSAVRSEMNKLANVPAAKALIPSNSNCATWYELPKDHKPDVSLRPIVSNCSSPTEKPSYLVERVLTQLLQFVPAHLTSSANFLDRLNEKYSGTLPEGSFLFTMDVSSLYTNIPIDEAISAASDMLQRHLGNVNTFGLTLLEVENLMKLCLNNSYFRFDESYYRQTSGVAMGNKMGPAIAILFMHQLELQMRATMVAPDFYVRYIDDICGLWVRGEEEFSQFATNMNALHPSIKFTTIREHPDGSVAFLDVLLTHQQDHSYKTGLYIKDTHSGIVLHYLSAHPRRTKLNTLKNEIRRAHRLSSDPQSSDLSVKKIKHLFQRNGYPRKILEQADRQVRMQVSHVRSSNYSPSPGSPEGPVYLSLPFADDET